MWKGLTEILKTWNHTKHVQFYACTCAVIKNNSVCSKFNWLGFRDKIELYLLQIQLIRNIEELYLLQIQLIRNIEEFYLLQIQLISTLTEFNLLQIQLIRTLTEFNLLQIQLIRTLTEFYLLQIQLIRNIEEFYLVQIQLIRNNWFNCRKVNQLLFSTIKEPWMLYHIYAYIYNIYRQFKLYLFDDKQRNICLCFYSKCCSMATKQETYHISLRINRRKIRYPSLSNSIGKEQNRIHLVPIQLKQYEKKNWKRA